MANEKYLFLSCVTENQTFSENNSANGTNYIGANTSETQKKINSQYANSSLKGLVTGVGYGWQKFIVQKNGNYHFVVRGGAGGTSYRKGPNAIDPVTGIVTGKMNRGGRGAKIEANIRLSVGDILYILVGLRGSCGSNSYGGGGGGASVILKDNPSGAFNFIPLNRKVDVLIVAGGGAGGHGIRDDKEQNSTNLLWIHGNDAVLENGTNTNGGISWAAYGGAGLTSSPTRGVGSNNITSAINITGSAPNAILSGAPAYTSIYNRVAGGWCGGGTGYVVGGGGGGYSGGDSGPWGAKKCGALVDSPSKGGTSFANPLVCKKIIRGYATVEEDKERHLTNPWMAYGAIEMELTANPNKFILAFDNDGYKYFDGETDDNTSFTNEWRLLDSQVPPTDEIFKNFGAATITGVAGLQDDVRFLVSSSEENESLTIMGNVAGTIVKMKDDASLADVSELINITLSSNLTNLIMKFAISKDYGKTWQTYTSGAWTNIDILNKIEFKNNGYDVSFFSAIPIADWQAYNAKTLRFAFYIEQNGNNDNSILNNISYIANLVGSWKHFTENQASYEYITDDTVEITFKEAGNYKVNYLDSIS